MTLNDLKKLGVHVSLVDDDTLRYSAPEDIATEELMQEIRDNKANLISEIRETLSKGEALLDTWRVDQIPVWKAIRDESLKADGSPDWNRRAYAIWLLEEVLLAED